MTHDDRLSALRERISSLPGPLVLAADIGDLGDGLDGERALRTLAGESVIHELADGVYGRMAKATYFDDILLELPISDLARQYAARLGARVVPTDEEYDLYRGASTQVPTGSTVGVTEPIAVVLESERFGQVRFEHVPDGLARLDALGVDELYIGV